MAGRKKICEKCGKEYIAKRSDTKYCPECKKRKTETKLEKKTKEIRRRQQGLRDDAVEAHKNNMTYGQLQAERYMKKQHREMQDNIKAFKARQKRM